MTRTSTCTAVDLGQPRRCRKKKKWISPPFPGARASFDLPKGRPGKAIVQTNNRNPQLVDAYELDIATGELTLLAENPGNVITWLRAPNGDLFTNTLTTDGDVEISQWDSATSTMRSIKVYDGTDYLLGIYPVVVSPDGTGIWLGSNEGSDRVRLARLDVATGAETEVDSHPTFDLGTQHGAAFALHPQRAHGRTDRAPGTTASAR